MNRMFGLTLVAVFFARSEFDGPCTNVSDRLLRPGRLRLW